MMKGVNTGTNGQAAPAKQNQKASRHEEDDEFEEFKEEGSRTSKTSEHCIQWDTCNPQLYNAWLNVHNVCIHEMGRDPRLVSGC